MPSFRLRARTATKIDCTLSKPLAHAGLAQPVEIVPIKSVFGTNYIDLRSYGYSEEDAKANAEKLADTLLLVGVKAGYGVDLTQGHVAFGEELITNHFQKNGEYLTPDNGGVTIYEEPAFFMRLSAQGTVTDDVVSLDDHLEKIGSLNLPMTERQRIAAELINDTYFEPSLNAAFVLSITAVEALCSEKPPSAFFQSAVSVILALVKAAHRLSALFHFEDRGADLDDLTLKLKGLQKRGSVRQGYMTKLRTLFDHKRAKEFDDLYKRRSSFVHNGLGRGSFAVDAPCARQIAIELLFADIATNTQA
jgi:hypothetical protein